MKLLPQIIYEVFCRLYSELVTNLECFFLKFSIKEKNSLEKNGYIKFQKKLDLSLKKSLSEIVFSKRNKSIYINKYHKRLILSKENLKKIIDTIFDKQFCNFLSSQTGFKYSIDFFGAYENFPIPKSEINQSWYANQYHLDKPNSKNMLKIFLPISNISIKDGPLELLDIKQTQQYSYSKKSKDVFKKNYFIGDLGDIFLCKLNLCLHKAGVPDEGRSTKLIMLQLNPSRKWYLNSKLYKRQYFREPKFTSFLNRFCFRKPLIFESL